MGSARTSTPEKPRLCHEVNVIPQKSGLQLRLGDEHIVVLEGASPAFLMEVLPLLDGSRPEKELIDRFGAEKANLVTSLLSELRREGLLEDQPQGIESIPLDASQIEPADRRIDVIGHEPLLSLLVESLGEEAGHREPHERQQLEDVPPQTSLLISAIERPDLDLLERTNQLAAERSLPALFVNLSHGKHATVGPFFIPNDGACYHCWHHRLLQNTASYEEQVAYDEAQRRATEPLKGVEISQGARLLVAGLVALEARAFFSAHLPVQTVNGALTVDLNSLRCWREPCWRIPWCEVCGAHR